MVSLALILQLDPAIPLVTPRGKGFALFLIDYSQEHDLIFVVAQDGTGEIWSWRNADVRMQENVSLGRKTADAPPKKPE